MLISYVLLLMVHQVSAWENLYTEVQQLGGSCYPNDTCVPSRNEEDDHLWGKHTCECGVHCVQSGTCCADSIHSGKVIYIKSQGETCQKLMHPTNEVMVVSRCSYRWQYGSQIRDKCENSRNEIGDPITMVPVTDLATHVTYKNYFCALCNCDTQDIYIWNIALQYDKKESSLRLSNITEDYKLKNLVYDKDLQSWGIMVDDKFYKINIKFRMPTSLQKIVKKCYLNMVTRCNPLYDYPSELKEKCLSYYAPIKLKIDGDFKFFRNIHCALCNNVNTSQSDGNACKLDFPKKGGPPSFSFALLLDINTNDGDKVGHVELCKKNETWDPFYKKCRSLVCALPGYVIKDGKCVKS